MQAKPNQNWSHANLNNPLKFMINPFSTNAPLLHLLKTSKNLRFSDVFRGYRSEALIENGLNKAKKMNVRRYPTHPAKK